MRKTRTALKEGTILRVPGGILYKIMGEPIGEGGGSLIYPVRRYLPEGNGAYRESPILYALKECYPLSPRYTFVRDSHGSIGPEGDEEGAKEYLERARQMQVTENEVTGEIYNQGFRLTPVLETYEEVEISQDQGESFQKTANCVSIMESLSGKGMSLKNCLKERKHLPADQAFRIVEQILYALREVHDGGYLHLDLQEGNIFLKGTLDDSSGIISLIDFGAARKRMEDGLCERIGDRVLYATPGFSSPEMLLGNDGTLRLGPEADIYSIGCLLLLLLTGRRTSRQELSMNKTGRYIPRFAIRKTKCPAHLTERMQAILAKALEEQPKDRYAGAEEMLADVTAFIELLIPRKNPLSAARYDAFICYKHGPVDTMAAKELRNALERYNGGSLLGRKPIGRVFLDEGELASCGDFGERIRDALEHSQWLVVICSEETKESPWVNDEIRTFLQYHGASRILAVVTEGEPGEVFPEALKKGGMDGNSLLAADARGENTRQIMKNIRGDVRLKIAAPILHTTFDALKQRKRIYEIKRASVLASAGLLALSAFLGYAALKSREIARQAVKIAQEHQAALQGQAMYLAREAEQSYEENNPLGAVDQALQACGLLEEAGLSIPDLIYTLSKSMGLYTLPLDAKETVKAAGIFEFEDKGGGEEYFLDSEGKYLFTSSEEYVNLWDTDTFQCVKTLTAPGWIQIFGENLLMDQEHQYLLASQEEIVCYDYDRDRAVWNYKLDHQAEDGGHEVLYGLTVSPNQEQVAAVTAWGLYVFDSEKGALLDFLEFSGEEGISYEGTAPVISPDKNWIVFGRTREEGQERLLETVLYHMPESQCTVISSVKDTGTVSFWERPHYFTSDNKLFLSFQKGMDTVYTSSVYKYYSEKLSLETAMYDPDKGSFLWKKERDYMSLAGRGQVFDLNYGGKKAVFLSYGKCSEILDQGTGKLLDSYEADAGIINAWQEEGKVFLALENGNLLYHDREEDRLTGYGYFPQGLTGCRKRGGNYYVRKRQALSYGSELSVIKYQEAASDEDYVICGALEEEGEAERYLPESLEYEPPRPSESVKATDSEDGRYSVRGEDDRAVIKDREKGEEKTLELEEAPESFFFLPKSHKLFIASEHQISLYDPEAGTLLDTVESELGSGDICAWQLLDPSALIYTASGGGSYVLALGEDSFEILYRLQDYRGYDPKENVFYFLSSTYSMEKLNEGIFTEEMELGKIKRRSGEDIIEMARQMTR